MFAEILFQMQFKPPPVLLLLASATEHSQQSERSILQKDTLKKTFQLENPIPFKSITWPKQIY